jgi:glycine betaine/choline ABC-type transport system substrate-binding protein
MSSSWQTGFSISPQQNRPSHPSFHPALESLAGTLPDRAMQRLNFEVDEKGRSPADVAREFLEKKGLL